MAPQVKSAAIRFAEKIDKSGGEDACWLYTGWIDPVTGYGRFWVSDGVNASAHRFAYELANGEIQEGLLVLHSCHVRACANPAHLRVGTHQDNQDDKVAAGRHLHGETHHQAKLTEADIYRIRAMGAEGWKQTAIAEVFGVTQANIWRILRRKTWTHLEDDDGE